MKVKNVFVYRSQACWVCEIEIAIRTSAQFTDEWHTVKHGGRWLWSAVWNAWRDARIVSRKLKAKRGERSAKGWAE